MRRDEDWRDYEATPSDVAKVDLDARLALALRLFLAANVCIVLTVLGFHERLAFRIPVFVFLYKPLLPLGMCLFIGGCCAALSSSNAGQYRPTLFLMLAAGVLGLVVHIIHSMVEAGFALRISSLGFYMIGAFFLYMLCGQLEWSLHGPQRIIIPGFLLLFLGVVFVHIFFSFRDHGGSVLQPDPFGSVQKLFGLIVIWISRPLVTLPQLPGKNS